MKICGFNCSNENKFIHLTCNIILLVMVTVIMGLSIFSPVAQETSLANSNLYYNGNRESKNVSLMINVYWGTEYLDSMLNTLEKHNITTTFFIGGCWAAQNNEMLNKIASKGHEIANHGYFHKDHKKLSVEENKNEIFITQELVHSLIGTKTELFAPPSGSYNEKVLRVAEKLGYKTILWSRDTIDWRDKNSDLIYNRAVNKTIGGDLILMHPTECTAKVLDKIIVGLKDKGLSITTVSKVIESKN